MYRINKRIIARGIEELLRDRLNRVEQIIRYDKISDEKSIAEIIAKYDKVEDIAKETGINIEIYNRRRNALAKISDAFFSADI